MKNAFVTDDPQSPENKDGEVMRLMNGCINPKILPCYREVGPIPIGGKSKERKSYVTKVPKMQGSEETDD